MILMPCLMVKNGSWVYDFYDRFLYSIIYYCIFCHKCHIFEARRLLGLSSKIVWFWVEHYSSSSANASRIAFLMLYSALVLFKITRLLRLSYGDSRLVNSLAFFVKNSDIILDRKPCGIPCQTWKAKSVNVIPAFLVNWQFTP